MSGCIQSVVVQEKVYVGGGASCAVMEYDTNSREWDTLTPYETSCFVMAGINNQLVLVGGYDEYSGASKVLGVWGADCKKWTYPYPEMPTGRYDCSVIVYSEWLVVAGGNTDFIVDQLRVDVLNTESKQWFAGPPLPQPWYNINAAVVKDTCYFIGGPADAYSVSIPTIISHITSDSLGKMDVKIWNEITAPPPNYGSFSLSLNGSLYAVGGFDSDNNVTTAIHLYQPDLEEWVKVGDLLSPRYFCACTMITNREMLIVGGYDDEDCMQERTDIAMIKCF